MERVLIVDGEPHVIRVVRLALEREGCQGHVVDVHCHETIERVGRGACLAENEINLVIDMGNAKFLAPRQMARTTIILA
ncbi:MAG: hypothetical protein O7B27_09700 [Gammaproteobacteria bacterium]|nr:hypothetical protein [Gammaproteobacteria bacterium]